MKIRATMNLRNNAMIEARKRLGFSQMDVAALTGISVSFISTLERLQFPKNYWEARILLIADTLEIKPDEVMPKDLVGQTIKNNYFNIVDISSKNLILYCEARQKRALIMAPDELLEKVDEIKNLNECIEDLPIREKQIIKLKFGLDGESPHTLEETGRLFKVTKERVRQVEAKAIRYLQIKLNEKSNKRRL